MSGASGLEHLKPFLPGKMAVAEWVWKQAAEPKQQQTVLESALEDSEVSEIMINGPGNVSNGPRRRRTRRRRSSRSRKRSQNQRRNRSRRPTSRRPASRRQRQGRAGRAAGEGRAHAAPDLDEAALERAAIHIARPLGLDPASSPIVDRAMKNPLTRQCRCSPRNLFPRCACWDARLDDGSRVAICVPPASPQVAITVRRFGKRSFSADDLVKQGALPENVRREAERTGTPETVSTGLGKRP